MKVNAVDNNSNIKQGALPQMGLGALIGAYVGYELKEKYPVTAQEKATPAYMRKMNALEREKNIYGPENEAWLNEIRAKGKDMSLAQDTFVKMYNGMKEGDKFGFGFNKKLRENFLALQNKDSASAQEFRRLMHEAKYQLERNIQRNIEGYNAATKAIRPTSFFVIGGAIVGALIALAHDILRTDVKN